MKRVVLVLVIVAAVGAGVGAYYLRRGDAPVDALTAAISRGDIIDAVGTTGTLQAVTTVQVGSQVSGNISYLGADFNSIVRKDQVIARLDPSLFQAQADQAKANVLKAQADVVQQEANVGHAKVALLDAQQKFGRAQMLMAKNLEPQADLDAAKIAVDSAQSGLESSEAALNSAKAVVGQAQANLNQSQVNLEHAIITAPVDGIVTQRNVDVGQTVASSLQAPTLFVIAADLTKMQVSANIDEADIGRIRPGQHATFRVDAYPTDTFEGTVSQIRLQPIVVQNVTTYATIIDVANPDLRLKPGMTTNLRIEVARKAGVLRVPNAAVRFRPSADIFTALNQAVPPDVAATGRGGRGGGGRGQNAQGGRRGRGGNAADDGQIAQGGGRRGGNEDGRVGGTNRGGRGANGGAAGQFAQGRGGRAGGGGGGRGGRGGRGRQQTAPESQPSLAQGATTIDALFAPLPPVESRGRIWLFADRQLKPVDVRLGITDGTFTELLDANLLDTNAQVVTGMTGVGARPQAAAGAAGNPFQQGRGGRGGGRGF
jgi:HlyD family secretion protein